MSPRIAKNMIEIRNNNKHMHDGMLFESTINLNFIVLLNIQQLGTKYCLIYPD